MMKSNMLNIIAVVLAVSVVLCHGQAYSGPPAHFNVRDYGVKGDGTDDTAALQKAFDEAAVLGLAEVTLPPGEYIISKAIKPKISVRGPATIRQKNPEEDVFYCENAYWLTFSNLYLRGGRTSLNLGNPNMEAGFIQIIDCKFFDSAAAAVQMREQSNSTFLMVKQCIFMHCGQALITYTDWTTMKDCWISCGMNPERQAMIEHRGGWMVLEDIVGIPVPDGADRRWIDNYGNLNVKDFRFGGEGAGFGAIVNFAKYSPHLLGTQIILENSPVCALGNSKRASAVYCEEIPNLIEVRNCNLAGIPAIKIDKKIDLKNYFKNVRPGMLKFSITGNVGEFAGEIPELLRNPVVVQDEGAKVIQLSEAETKKALAEAAAAQLRRPASGDAPAERILMDSPYTGRKQKAPAPDYLDITFEKYNWDLEDLMDGTSDRNSKYLAIAPAGDDVIIMRRIGPKDNWPHVLIRDVTVDLDKYPCLAWKLKDPGDEGKIAAFAYAIKVIDKETEQLFLVIDHYHGHDSFNYSACNLKEKFGKGGKRTFDIRFYYGATKYLHAPTEEDPGVIFTEPGGYMVLDFLRLEAE